MRTDAHNEGKFFFFGYYYKYQHHIITENCILAKQISNDSNYKFKNAFLRKMELKHALRIFYKKLMNCIFEKL